MLARLHSLATFFFGWGQCGLTIITENEPAKILKEWGSFQPLQGLRILQIENVLM